MKSIAPYIFMLFAILNHILYLNNNINVDSCIVNMLLIIVYQNFNSELNK